MERTSTRDGQNREAIAAIGAGVTITGEVTCQADLQIDGHVNGEVRCGTLFLGEGGMIEGVVQADRVRLSGVLDGTVVAGDLAIEATAQIKGELVYARLKVSAGAVIQGNLKHRPVEETASDHSPLKLVEAGEAAMPGPAPQRRVYID